MEAGNGVWTCNGLVPVTCLSLCHLSFKSQGAYAAQNFLALSSSLEPIYGSIDDTL
jgi:hypothetical protein